MNILGLAIAGAIGTVCRYEIGKVITYQQFPMATLSVNALGSLLLGFLFAKYAANQQQLFVILGIGFCGGFTTFSTFSLDLYKLLQAQQFLNFTAYLVLSLVLGIVSIFVGIYLAKLV